MQTNRQAYVQTNSHWTNKHKMDNIDDNTYTMSGLDPLIIMFYKDLCITRDAKTAVPLNGNRDGLICEADSPPPQLYPPEFSPAGSAKHAVPMNGYCDSFLRATNPTPSPFYDDDGHLEADGIKDAVSSRWTSISIQTVVSNYSLLV